MECPPATSVCGDAITDPVQLVVARTGKPDPATPAAYAAIAATLPRKVGVERARAQDGSGHIWFDHATVPKL
jgi:hypothetical protein